MKRTALFALAMGLALAANAQQQPDPHPVEPPARADAPVDGEVGARDPERETRYSREDRNCLAHTGSRLIRRDGGGRRCAMAAGRAYTAEDLSRTGATNVADALRMLDSSIY